MGTVINFQVAARAARAPSSIATKPESAAVIILPVVRIERYIGSASGDLEPQPGSTAGRRRRRRANR
ncbi:MAG: hypothetical protein E6G86_01050 [Alphaproteobacteria bacterium]|nr:MAG: hypothetical protein E6G86_01050 [Alphaproteobacteria bacterium]